MEKERNLWQIRILNALKAVEYDTSFLEYSQKEDDHGKGFMTSIAISKGLYDYLNIKGLVNTEICPITGEILKNKNNSFSCYGRKIFLSENGKNICEDINRKERAATGYDYDKEKKLKSLFPIINLLIWATSFISSYIIIKPKEFWYFFLFLAIGFITRSLLNKIFIKISINFSKLKKKKLKRIYYFFF